MVDPADVEHILTDAARLIGRGEMVVFGSSALAFWLKHAPASRDVDLWCEPADRGDIVLALMGEESWYHKRHMAYVEVWGPETFRAPRTWRARTKTLVHSELKDVHLVIPHPHDILMAKVERGTTQDWEHAALILNEYPLTLVELETLAAEMPHRQGQITEPESVARFEANYQSLRRRFFTPPAG